MSTLKKFVSVVLVLTMLMSSFACLGTVFAEDSPVFTDVYGNEFTKVGPIGSTAQDHAANKADYDAAYGTGSTGTDGWIYLAADCYEVPAADIANYDVLKNATITDGYVKKGDYIFTALTIDLSDGYYLYTPSFVLPFTNNFFKSVKTVSGAKLNVKADSNTDMATYAARMNPDNGMVGGTTLINGVQGNVGFYVGGYTVEDNMYSSSNVTAYRNQTKLTDAALGSLGVVKLTTAKDTGAKYVFKPDSSTWFMGYLLQVKDNLSDGAVGAIWCPKYIYKSKTAYGLSATDYYNGQECNASAPGNIQINFASNVNTGKNQNQVGATLITEDFGAVFTIGDPPTATTTATFKVDGETFEEVEVDEDGKVAAPTKEPEAPAGYTFAGWSDEEDGDAVEFPYAIDANTTFYPVFEAIAYTAYFMVDGEEFAKVTGLNINNTVDAPEEDPEAPAGSTFSGWVASETSTELITFPQTVGAEDLYFYAKFSSKPTHTASFINGIDDSVIKSGSVVEDDSIVFPEAPTVEGYDFVKWVSDGAEVTALTMGTADVTVTAVYEAKQFTMTFDANGGKFGENSAESNDAAFGSDIVAPETNPEKAGYTFIGWNTDAAATAKLDDLGTVPASEKTFYAVWEANSYSISYFANKDDAEPHYVESSVKSGTKIPVPFNTNNPAPTAPLGKAFAAWKLAKDDSELSTIINNPFKNATFDYAEDVAAYIEWNDAPIVTFKMPDGNGGWVALDTAFNSGVTIDKAAVIAEAKDKAAELGVEFADDTVTIYSDEACTTAFTAASYKITGTDDAVFYLGKLKSDVTITIGDYVVTKNGTDGDTIEVDVETVRKNNPGGKNFTGIYEEGDESKTPITPKSTTARKYTYTIPGGTHNYLPLYEDVNYVVEIDVGDTMKNIIANTTAKIGDNFDMDNLTFTLLGDLNVPKIGDDGAAYGKPGYVVSGWTSSNGKVDFSEPTVLTESNLKDAGAYGTATKFTVKVKYEAVPFTATFVLTDGATFSDGSTEKTLEVLAGTSMNDVKKLAAEAFGDVVCEGATLTGWYFLDSTGTPKNDKPMPAADTTYYSTITANQLMVELWYTFDEEGNLVKSVDKASYYGEEASKYTDYELEYFSWPSGYVFDGWEIAEGQLGKDADGNEIITTKLVLKAKYIPMSDFLLVYYEKGFLNTDSAKEKELPQYFRVTITKKLKIQYWKDGKKVSKEEANSKYDEGEIPLLYIPHIIKPASGGWYIACMHFSMAFYWWQFKPSELGNTIKLIVDVIKNLL